MGGLCPSDTIVQIQFVHMLARRMAVWLVAALLAIDVGGAAWLWMPWTARHAPAVVAPSTRKPASHELPQGFGERAAGVSTTRVR
jgi:hypothetical protein